MRDPYPPPVGRSGGRIESMADGAAQRDATMNLHVGQDIDERIQQEVAEGLSELPIWLRWWVRAHLIPPRPVVLCTDPDCAARATFWLVTDHVGLDDAAFRIVFDGSGFGLELTLEDGVAYLVHRAARLAEAVDCL
jgi:hypothetical protein